MLKKKNVIFIFTFVLIVLCLIAFFFIYKNRNSKTTNTPNTSPYKDTYSVSGLKNNKLEKDGIIVENIDISKTLTQVKVVSTIKNSSNNTINGFFIQINLLDENNKPITSVSKNYTSQISSGNSITIENYITEIENMNNIQNAEIATLNIY